jgi:hypothetical protein
MDLQGHCASQVTYKVHKGDLIGSKKKRKGKKEAWKGSGAGDCMDRADASIESSPIRRFVDRVHRVVDSWIEFIGSSIGVDRFGVDGVDRWRIGSSV